MNITLEQILGTILVVVLAFIAKQVLKRILVQIREKNGFEKSRKIMISKIFNAVLAFLALIILLGIWEIETEDLAFYFASVFTIIGVAFFAQWSHLSNITASIILYLSNPVKIGDEIVIHDEEKIIGRIDDIGMIFVTIITEDNKQLMFTNTLFMQKMWSVKPRVTSNYFSSKQEKMTSKTDVAPKTE